MYDIATLELDDGIVMVAVNAIINGQTFVPAQAVTTGCSL